MTSQFLTLPVLHTQQATTLPDFIRYWSRLYAYAARDLYARIHMPQLTSEDLHLLFEWKNGMKLSGGKITSLKTKILSKLDRINALKAAESVDAAAFRQEFADVSAVWSIFLLHIVQPRVYPIYDQHVHRAYCFINGQPYEDINTKISKKQKLNFYFEEYLPFVRAAGIEDLKQMDEAFFAFGQFLNIGHQKQVVK